MNALVVQAGGQPAAVFECQFTVGREDAPSIPDCGHLVVPDIYATPRHAAFVPGEDGWSVQDLASTNGTWLNGQRIHGPHPVAKGDKVRVGHTTLTVVPLGN